MKYSNAKPLKKQKKKEHNYTSDLNPPKKLSNPSRDTIITQLYGRSDLKIIIKKIAKVSYLVEELTSELFLQLCKMNHSLLVEKYLREDNEQIDFWIITTLKNMFNSSSSPFYHKIKKWEIGQSMTEKQKQTYKLKQLTEQTESNAELYKEVLTGILDPMHLLEKKHRDILNLYRAEKTYKGISVKTGIHVRYIREMMKDARVELGKKIASIVANHKDQNFINDLFNDFKDILDE